jgi:hypothetical protein
MAGEDMVFERRQAIRGVADRHGLTGIRWWPPGQGDFLVEDLPDSLRDFQADLQRTLGVPVAIYLADRLSDDDRARLEGETVELGAAAADGKASPEFGVEPGKSLG